MYLLDTNVCIHFLNGSNPKIMSKLGSFSPSEICMCSIVKAELIFGARKSSKVDSNLNKLNRFFAPFLSLPFDDRCAEEYGVIRADLSAQGKLIGPNDMLIAAVARAYNTALITHNTSEFYRITGLQVEDWE